MANVPSQRRKPKPRIKARLVPLPLESRHLARCGRCGQFLWTVMDGDSLGPSWLNDLKPGWLFDPVGRIWRPTETHLNQRRAVNARVLAGTATAFDRTRLRLGGFGRRRTRSMRDEDGSLRRERFGHFAGAHLALSPPPTSRFGATADLPVAVQCPRCGAENELKDPVARPD